MNDTENDNQMRQNHDIGVTRPPLGANTMRRVAQGCATHLVTARPNEITFPKLGTTPAVDRLLARNCVVAIGISGGKDGEAAALEVKDYLDAIGHAGPRVLIHADLGLVEWRDSLPSCERLAEHIGWDLIVVRRAAGGMLERWESRWKANIRRYTELTCVRVILPWSTPAMRFCTSEMKEAVIAAELKKRYPDHEIVNVTGIRRQESVSRAKKPISAPSKKLTRRGLAGITWNPIIEWKTEQVFKRIELAGLALHEAYRIYGASRVSCAFCIMSAAADLRAAANCPDNQKLYIRMVQLEADSGYALQGTRWLADVAPELLPAELKAAAARAKALAACREKIEARIPDHLLYVKGWPTVMPTDREAELLAGVREEIGRLYGWELACVTPESVTARYADLMAKKGIGPKNRKRAGRASR